LIERRDDFGTVASGALSNSQTIHCGMFSKLNHISLICIIGDIETNYNINKATLVKRQADMLRNYATKLPEGQRDQYVFVFNYYF
jgi:malate dehydrogenase (quinone)